MIVEDVPAKEIAKRLEITVRREEKIRTVWRSKFGDQPWPEFLESARKYLEAGYTDGSLV